MSTHNISWSNKKINNLILPHIWIYACAYYNFLHTRAHLSKPNDVVSLRIVKILIIKYGIYANIFAENVNSICKSYSHFFNKNSCELDFVFTRTVDH